jgi:hypothetical protein
LRLALDEEAARNSPWPTPASLHELASQIAESALPEDHPMVALTKSFCDDSAVCAPDEARVNLPAMSPSAARRRLKGQSPSNSQSCPKLLGALPERGSPSAPDLNEALRSGRPEKQPPPSTKGEKKKKSAPEESGEPAQKIVQFVESQASKRAHGARNEEPSGPRNIFHDYVADHKMEMEMAKPWFNNQQDELRKHVNEKSRFVRLQDHGKDVYALADTKYSAIGHKIAMDTLHKTNYCRKEPALIHAAKQVGAASPEVFATIQLKQTLDPNAKMLGGGKKKKKHHD